MALRWKKIRRCGFAGVVLLCMCKLRIYQHDAATMTRSAMGSTLDQDKELRRIFEMPPSKWHTQLQIVREAGAEAEAEAEAEAREEAETTMVEAVPSKAAAEESLTPVERAARIRAEFETRVAAEKAAKEAEKVAKAAAKKA